MSESVCAAYAAAKRADSKDRGCFFLSNPCGAVTLPRRVRRVLTSLGNRQGSTIQRRQGFSTPNARRFLAWIFITLHHLNAPEVPGCVWASSLGRIHFRPISKPRFSSCVAHSPRRDAPNVLASSRQFPYSPGGRTRTERGVRRPCLRFPAALNCPNLIQTSILLPSLVLFGRRRTDLSRLSIRLAASFIFIFVFLHCPLVFW